MIYLLHFDRTFGSGSYTLQQFFDDFLIVGVCWSKGNHLQLNVKKIKGLVVDFRQCEKQLTPVIIQGEGVEMVETYKYLCVYINKAGRSDKKRDAVQERPVQSLLTDSSEGDFRSVQQTALYFESSR